MLLIKYFYSQCEWHSLALQNLLHSPLIPQFYSLNIAVIWELQITQICAWACFSVCYTTLERCQPPPLMQRRHWVLQASPLHCSYSASFSLKQSLCWTSVNSVLDRRAPCHIPGIKIGNCVGFLRLKSKTWQYFLHFSAWARGLAEALCQRHTFFNSKWGLHAHTGSWIIAHLIVWRGMGSHRKKTQQIWPYDSSFNLGCNGELEGKTRTF